MISRRPWSAAELAMLQAQTGWPDRLLAERLGRTRKAVKHKRAALGIPSIMRPWTPAEDAMLLAARPTPPRLRTASEGNTEYLRVAERTGRTLRAVYGRLQKLRARRRASVTIDNVM